jgi:hypothetical protein
MWLRFAPPRFVVYVILTLWAGIRAGQAVAVAIQVDRVCHRMFRLIRQRAILTRRKTFRDEAQVSVPWTLSAGGPLRGVARRA